MVLQISQVAHPHFEIFGLGISVVLSVKFTLLINASGFLVVCYT